MMEHSLSVFHQSAEGCYSRNNSTKAVLANVKIANGFWAGIINNSASQPKIITVSIKGVTLLESQLLPR